MRHLRRPELPSQTPELARYLIGKNLVLDRRGTRMSGRIVETEAYLIDDEACHAFRGRTARNQSLFLSRGHAYIYYIYGNHFMMNVSSEAANSGAGVLIRAIEPTDGVELMRSRRGVKRIADLTNGPGKLTAALGIDARYDGVDLCSDKRLWLGTGSRSTGPIGTSVRIGLTRAADRELRFFEAGNPFLSGSRALNHHSRGLEVTRSPSAAFRG
ncbi:MAG: DNA-3-methyladenine glycosylase [Candidatus Eremiobacteraeota bacterium]|nr:DNA-3-methyladenine glycosylase [Candidatus Eremiobacteraeota bacterium]